MYRPDIDWTPYDYWALEERNDIFIEKEMQNYKERALEKFTFKIPHPEFAFKIALSIIAGYRESLLECENIIEDLNLEDMEICSIEDNFEKFKELYIKKLEEEPLDIYSIEDL